MPVVRTSVGRRPSAWLTRFCTSTGGEVLIARRRRRSTVIVDDAAVGARRGHVEHALDAVDRLLERRRDRGLDCLRVGAGVERGDGDLRRRQLGILRDRQRRNRDRAGEDDDQRADRREDRPADEGVDEHRSTAALHRRAVADLLDARHDHAGRPAFRPLVHDVVVAERSRRPATGRCRATRPLRRRLGDEAEVLAVDAQRPATTGTVRPGVDAPDDRARARTAATRDRRRHVAAAALFTSTVCVASSTRGATNVIGLVATTLPSASRICTGSPTRRSGARSSGTWM